jgi:hypothetical protein
MKYLKIFEDLNTDGYEVVSHNSDNGYQRCTPSQKVIDTICKLGGKDKFKYNEWNQSLHNQGYEGKDNIYIWTYVDDWYWVKISSSTNMNPNRIYFKCDQLDGLLNCLKKEFNIY